MDTFDFQALKQSLPDFKVIDISVINDIDRLYSVCEVTEPNVVLASFRSINNSQVWSSLDSTDFYIENMTRIKAPQRPAFRLWNKDNYLNIYQGNGLTTEDIGKRIRLWLQSETQDNCYVCDEKIEMAGPLCNTCFKATCLTCFYKSVMQNISNPLCPLCRCQLTKSKK